LIVSFIAATILGIFALGVASLAQQAESSGHPMEGSTRGTLLAIGAGLALGMIWVVKHLWRLWSTRRVGLDKRLKTMF
jgi:hypothetical protein